jgi:hypothetical protein
MPPANLHETLQANMPEMLSEAVRQDQRSPDFEISSWTVSRLSDQGIMNPDGLWLFRGDGRDGGDTRSWSIVLKVFDEPEAGLDISNYWNGKREALAMQSGLLANLPPDTVVAPRCYGVEERDGCHWIWMEFVHDHSARRWTSDEFSFAARQLGRFNGAYLTGTPLPDFAWLCGNAVRDWANSFPPDEPLVWENDYVARVFSGELRDRVMRLWDERDRFFDAIDSLPRTFLHGDAQRRNLFIRKHNDETHEVAAIDWQVCGIGPLGGDLSVLVGTSAVLFEFEPSEITRIEAVSFENYLAGLREAGWDGEANMVRLAYCMLFAIRFGPSTPPLIARWTRHRLDQILGLFGREPERFVSDVAALCEYALDRGDEARLLMNRRF